MTWYQPGTWPCTVMARMTITRTVIGATKMIDQFSRGQFISSVSLHQTLYVYVCLTKQSNGLKDTDKITLSWNSHCVRWTRFHSLIHVFSLLQMFYIPPKICYLEINVGFLSWNTTLDHQPTVCRHTLWCLLGTTVSNSLACMKYLRMTNARSSQVHHNYVCV